MSRILLVTGNRNKLQEMLDIFGATGFSFQTLQDYPAIEISETGDTFLRNARIKAETAAKTFNVIALGEDSGLVVDALGGKPGVRSRRFAGENATDNDNNRLLLETMKDIPASERSARFVSAVVVCKPNGNCIEATGTLEGSIAFAPAGSFGFGYDPLFLLPALKRTLAELPDDEKNLLSHRKQALEKLRPLLAEFLAP